MWTPICHDFPIVAGRFFPASSMHSSSLLRSSGVYLQVVLLKQETTGRILVWDALIHWQHPTTAHVPKRRWTQRWLIHKLWCSCRIAHLLDYDFAFEKLSQGHRILNISWVCIVSQKLVQASVDSRAWRLFSSTGKFSLTKRVVGTPQRQHLSTHTH